MFEIMDRDSQEAVIKVIGVGGCGGNAIEHMIDNNVNGVEFIVANTDMQVLKKSRAKIQLQLGAELTRGLGAGGREEAGRLLLGLPPGLRDVGAGGGLGGGGEPVFVNPG